MDTTESSAAHAHPPSNDDHHETVEAHYYSGLEHPHACNDGWVTIGQIAVDPQTGEEVVEYALYLCRKCVEHTAWA
jgi:hypothetical protein